MNIIVIGAGVIGVTSAYYLAQEGHRVTVLDRQIGPALETSFANAGEISPGYSAPWAAPGVPLKALRWMFAEHAPLVIKPRLDFALMRWLAAFLPNCTQDSYIRNKRLMIELAEYSRSQIEGLRDQIGVAYDQRTQGTLQVFKKEKQVAGMALDRRVLDEIGVQYEALDVDGCIAAEPALKHVRGDLLGGLRLPGDETGDCYKFTVEFARLAREAGVDFRFGTEVTKLHQDGKGIRGVETRQGVFEADAYVLAAASYAPALAAPLGIRLPIYPVKGYSLTATVTDIDRAPVSTVMNETFKVAITRLGDRIRIGGMAELSGFNHYLDPARRRTLELSAKSLFAGSCDLDKAEFWTGWRPMTPDGPPIVGRSHISNLFLNCGHGTLGWTMSCGWAAFLADLIA